MNDITGNPYTVVGSPNYAVPVLNLFGDKSPTQGQQANQQNKAQTNPNFMQQLLKFFGPQTQTPTYTATNPIGTPASNFGGNIPNPGTPWGTGGNIAGLY
jgi:hypothetical protein